MMRARTDSGEEMMHTAVLASDRPWTDGLAQRLSQRTGWAVHDVSDERGLARDALDRIRPDLVLIPFWSRIVPPEIHEAFECVIFHSSQVPYGRGGSPIQNLIVRGFEETQLSALRCEAELDAGPVYARRLLRLDGSLDAILERCVALIEELCVEIMLERPRPAPQEGDVVRFRRRTPDQSHIGDVTSVREAYDRIRMVDADGYPRAFIDLNHLRVEFRNAELSDGRLTVEARFIAREHS